MTPTEFQRAGYCVLLFLTGFVTGLNLSQYGEGPPDWRKAPVAVLFAIFFSVLLLRKDA